MFGIWTRVNGSMAGESSSVSTTEVQDPSLGCYINLKKCELFGSLSSFPPTMQTSKQPNIEILGADATILL